MVKPFINLLLQNQMTETWYTASSTQVLPSFLKWWPKVLWPFYAKVRFGSLHETGSQVSDTAWLVLRFCVKCILVLLARHDSGELHCLVTALICHVILSELLGRFSLWSICNEVIKLSHLPQIAMMNQQSTIIHLRCNKCNKPLLRCGWLCDRCKLVTNLCSIW